MVVFEKRAACTGKHNNMDKEGWNNIFDIQPSVGKIWSPDFSKFVDMDTIARHVQTSQKKAQQAEL